MSFIYADGKRVQAILLRRSGNSMRVAVPGKDDVMELVSVHGVWVTDECEPVDVEFEWQKGEVRPIGSGDSEQLASRLAYSLLAAAGRLHPQLPS